MLHFVIGKPRSGKSYYAAANQKGGGALVRELLNPDGRYIVTNLPLVVDELEEFIARKGKRIDMCSRVTLLDHSQVRQFWRYRGGGYVRSVPENDPAEKQELQILQNEEIYAITNDAMHKRGVLYILDEVHVYYPARGCIGKTGNWVFQYITQHGHFSDTIIMITQSLSYVEKQFRECTQDYTYMENERLRKIRGFRKGGGLVARTFIFPPTLGTEEADHVEALPLDTEGYGRIYDTSGGAGIAGGGQADKGAKVKGLPLKSIWLFAALALVLIYVAAQGGLSLLHRWADGPKGKKAPAAQPLAAASSPSGPADPVRDKATPPTFPRADDPSPVQQQLTWRRIFQHDGKYYVVLSDSRVVTSPSRIDYDSAGVVDLVDLEGRHWRISRAPLMWASTETATEAKK